MDCVPVVIIPGLVPSAGLNFSSPASKVIPLLVPVEFGLPTLVATPKLEMGLELHCVPLELRMLPDDPGDRNPRLVPPTKMALFVRLETPVPPFVMGRRFETLELKSILPANMPLVTFPVPILVTPRLFIVTSPERLRSTAAFEPFPTKNLPSFRMVPAKVVFDKLISVTLVILPLASTVICGIKELPP